MMRALRVPAKHQGVRHLENSRSINGLLEPAYADKAVRAARAAEVYPMSTEIPRTHCSNWFAIDGSFCAVTRKDGPEMLTAATGSLCASRRGTAMQRSPSSKS